MSFEGVKINWNDDAVMEMVKTAIRVGSKKGADKIFTSAKAANEFDDQTGNLRKGIKLFPSKYKDGGYVVASTAPHSHLVEYGHALVSGGTLSLKRKAKNMENTGRGTIVGTVPPRPFIRNALKKNRSRAEQCIIDEVKRAVT